MFTQKESHIINFLVHKNGSTDQIIGKLMWMIVKTKRYRGLGKRHLSRLGSIRAPVISRI